MVPNRLGGINGCCPNKLAGISGGSEPADAGAGALVAGVGVGVAGADEMDAMIRSFSSRTLRLCSVAESDTGAPSTNSEIMWLATPSCNVATRIWIRSCTQ